MFTVVRLKIDRLKVSSFRTHLLTTYLLRNFTGCTAPLGLGILG